MLPLPVPASVYGLVLLLAALNFKLVKLDDVKEVGTYLTGIFPLLFVPAAAGVMELWAEMGEMLLPILVAIIPVTVLVMVSAGKTTQALTGRKKKEADNDAATEQGPQTKDPRQQRTKTIATQANIHQDSEFSKSFMRKG